MGGNQSTVETSMVNKEAPLFASSTQSPTPTVGRIVHYVASNTLVPGADGKTYPDIRAMLITSVTERDGNTLVTGQVFRAGQADQHILQMLWEVMDVPQDELEMKSGTWHWPLRA
jgi:hypothetical protein